jgi:hypothetical protein
MKMTCGHKARVTVDAVAESFAKAESAIKQNERLTLSIPLPSINQLRYASYHLIKFLQCSIDDASKSYHLDCALGHCKRARFDAIDGIIYSCLDFITAFQKLCRSRIGLEDIYPDYRSDYDAMADVQDRFVVLRKVQHMTESDMADFEALASQVVSFKRKVLRLKVKVEALECKQGNDESIVASQQFLISFVATVFGTLIGAVGLLLTIWSMLPASMWWRCSTIIIMVAGVLFGIFKFYCWAVRHMLSSRQRAVLEEKYHFDFD